MNFSNIQLTKAASMNRLHLVMILLGCAFPVGTFGPVWANDPTPVPTVACSCPCKPFAPTPCPTCHFIPNDENRSWINVVDGGSATIGSAGSNSGCCYDPEDPCAPVINSCTGIHFATIANATMYVYRLAEDGDTWCGASSGKQNYDEAAILTYDGIGPIISEHSRLRKGSVGISGITLLAPSTACGSGSEGAQPTSKANLHVLDTKVTLSNIPTFDERISDETCGFTVTWNCSPPSGETCAGSGTDLLANVEISFSASGGNKSFSSAMGQIDHDWSGSFEWDGSLGSSSWWDGTSGVTVNVGITPYEVTTDPFGGSPGCTCHVASGGTDWVKMRLLDACGCEEKTQPCVCELGAAGGIARSGGADCCNKIGSGGFPFFDYERDQTVKPFGTSNGYAGDRLFKYAKRSSLITNDIEIFEGGKVIELLTPVANSSETLWHDSNRDIVAHTFSSGGTTYLEWDTGGYLYAFIKPSGSTAQFIVSATDPDTSEVTEYTYGALFTPGHLTTITTGSDVTDLAWDNTNKWLKTIEFPSGASEEFIYTGTAFTGMKQWYDGRLVDYTTWVVNGTSGRIEEFEKHALESPFSVIASNDYVYSSTNNQLLSYEKFGNTYSIVRNATNRTKTLVHPDSSSIEYKTERPGGSIVETTTVRDSGNAVVAKNLVETQVGSGLILFATDGIGAQTDYTYGFHIESDTDEVYRDLLHKVKQPLNNYTEYIYDATRVEKVAQYGSTGPAGSYVEYDYDSDGRVTRTYTGTLTETERTYEDDNLRFITDGEGRNTFFEYNGEDQLAGVGDGSATSTFEYDGDGRRVRTQSPEAIRTGYEYHGPTGKLLKVHNDVGSSSDYDTEYQYSIGNYGDDLEAVIDAEGRKTGYEYDVWGRLSKENIYSGTNSGNYSLADSITYTYDSGMGEYLLSKTDMNGHKTEYEYFAPGFLKTKTWTEAGESIAWGTVEYDYLDTGALWKATTVGGDCGCGASTRFYQYNSNGQVSNHTAAFGNGWVFYDYDGIGRLDEIRIPDKVDSTLNTVTYIYDAANRLTDVNASINSANPADATMAYNKANQVTDLSLDGGSATVHYDYWSTTGRLWKMTTTAQDKARTFAYGYNNDGLRTSTTNMVGGSAKKVTYQYDNLNRLTQESFKGIKPSECVDLNGSQQIDIASGGDLAGSFDEFTVDMRIKIDAYPTGYNEAVLFERGADGSGNWIKLYIDSTGFVRIRVETGEQEKTKGIGPIPLSTWVHVGGAFLADDGIDVFLDGQSSSIAIDGSVGAFAGSPTIGESFDGKIDEVHIRNDYVSSFDPSVDYTAGATTLGLWHFDEGSGSRSREDDTETARYVRVWSDDLGNAVSQPTIYNLNVIEIYAYDAGGTNLASGDTAVGRTAHQSAGNYLASNVTDGDLDPDAQGMYAAYYDNDCCDEEEWVYVDLGTGEAIATVDVLWRTDGALNEPNSWKLQKSDNGTSWTDVKSFTSYSYPVDYLETVDIGQNAVVPSGAWSTNYEELGVGSFSREYEYDKVGNRTEMSLYDENGDFSRDIVWTLQYNTLNQLTQKFDGTSWTSGNERWSYGYDDNGNLTSVVQEVYNASVWEVSEEWKYKWNPRDQMTQAMKWAGSSSTTDNVGAVAYEYCLSCDGALSMRLEYDAGTDDELGTLAAGLRYEYDGLNRLRVDELFNYDGDGSIQDELDYYRNTATYLRHRVWRTVEVSTHRPGQLSALLHKRVYLHTNNDATPDQTKDFTYAHDQVGNVLTVFDSAGNEAFSFAQDAFGNELPINSAFGASDWGTAAGEDYRITEHQTGKWMDGFTGLYYFHARFYDPEVGRFVGRDAVRQVGGDIYAISMSNPVHAPDPSGFEACTKSDQAKQLKEIRYALLDEVERQNNDYGWSDRPSGCTSWSTYLKAAVDLYNYQQKTSGNKQCWDVRIVAGYKKLLYAPAPPGGFLPDTSCDQPYVTGTRHQVIELHHCCNKWEDPDNIVFDAWRKRTVFTGKGFLKQSTMKAFRNEYPIDSPPR